MADPRIRQIKIKTGVLKRLAKEEASYREEAKMQEVIIEQKKSQAVDPFLIKQLTQSLQETIMMIPDSRRRMSMAHADLFNLLEAEEELRESAEYQEARSVLDSIKLEA